MPQESGAGRLSRRNFLRGLAVAGVAAGGPGLLAACDRQDTATGGDTAATSRASGDALRIGLMVPLSGTYASLGRDMVNGMRLYLAQHGNAIADRPVELITVETEAVPEVGIGAARRLVDEEQVDLVTGIVSSAVALGVRDLFHEARVPLIVSNAGANQLSRAQVSPYIFRTSFSNWQPCFSIGEWAVDNVDAGAGFYVIAPDYAAGHEDAAAFRQAYVDGGGGTIVEEAFPPFATTQDYQPYLSTVDQSGAGAVFAFFSGGEAINFVQQYASFGLKDRLPLIGPGFLTDDSVLAEIGPPALGMRTSLHYTPLLDTPLNRDHVAAYTEVYGGPPTPYSVAQYDVGTLIASTLEATGGETDDVDAVVAAMAAVGAVASPRGEWTMDPDSHNPVQSFYLLEVREVEGGLGNVVIDDLGDYADPGPDAAT